MAKNKGNNGTVAADATTVAAAIGGVYAPDETVRTSAPVALNVTVTAFRAYVIASEKDAAQRAETADQLVKSFKGIAANVATHFAGTSDNLDAYKPVRVAFDKAVVGAFEGAPVAAETIKRYVRLLLAAASVKRPESTAPKAVQQKADRTKGAVLAALDSNNAVTLAAAMEKCSEEMREDLRTRYADDFERVERIGGKVVALLKLISENAPDSPTMERLYIAAGI